VVSVTKGGAADRAGLRAGDRIVAIGGRALGLGPRALAYAATAVRVVSVASAGPLMFNVVRSGEPMRFLAAPDAVCNYRVRVVASRDLNAFSDGLHVFVTSGFMQIVDDDELSVILAHEIAHNSMGHVGAKFRNAGTFVWLYFIVDGIARLTSRQYMPPSNPALAGPLGAALFSKGFEAEADYVAMYELALAGRSVEAAPRLWRHVVGDHSGRSIIARTHPTTAERVVRMRKTIVEINSKVAAGQPLHPETKRQATPSPQ
jgi:beta-barrel assembly-enhancing protease